MLKLSITGHRRSSRESCSGRNRKDATSRPRGCPGDEFQSTRYRELASVAEMDKFSRGRVLVRDHTFRDPTCLSFPQFCEICIANKLILYIANIIIFPIIGQKSVIWPWGEPRWLVLNA